MPVKCLSHKIGFYGYSSHALLVCSCLLMPVPVCSHMFMFAYVTYHLFLFSDKAINLVLNLNQQIQQPGTGTGIPNKIPINVPPLTPEQNSAGPLQAGENVYYDTRF